MMVAAGTGMDGSGGVGLISGTAFIPVAWLVKVLKNNGLSLRIEVTESSLTDFGYFLAAPSRSLSALQPFQAMQ
jgi:hypothetical protein